MLLLKGLGMLEGLLAVARNPISSPLEGFWAVLTSKLYWRVDGVDVRAVEVALGDGLLTDPPSCSGGKGADAVLEVADRSADLLLKGFALAA